MHTACTCIRAWGAIIPPPPCPVHGTGPSFCGPTVENPDKARELTLHTLLQRIEALEARLADE